MIESLIFYGAKNGTVYENFGKEVKINSFGPSSDYLGGLFYAFSLPEINGVKIVDEKFTIESKKNRVIAKYSKSMITNLKNDELGMVALILPEDSNIFLDTITHLYSLLEDESQISGCSYNNMCYEFLDHFSEKSQKYFKKMPLNKYVKSFNEYSDIILSSIEKMDYSIDSFFYSTVIDYLNEQKDLLKYSTANKNKIISLIKDYNKISNEKLSYNSSIIADYARMCKVFGMISSKISQWFGDFSSDVFKEYLSSTYLAGIKQGFSINDSQLLELEQAIRELELPLINN